VSNHSQQCAAASATGQSDFAADAAINVQLAAVSSTGQDYGSFLDSAAPSIQQLSGIIDVSQISDGTSLT